MVKKQNSNQSYVYHRRKIINQKTLMNPSETLLTTYSPIEERILFSKFLKIQNTCEQLKNTMIGIYLIKEDRFMYCNQVFENMFGYRAQCLVQGGWKFWYSLIKNPHAEEVKFKVIDFFKNSTVKNELTLKYPIRDSTGNEKFIQHELFHYNYRKKSFTLNYCFDISEKKEIENCLTHQLGYKSLQRNNSICIPISLREKEVLKLIADGYSSKQIADKLCISNHTAISHRKSLIQKFEVKNTAQLIKQASKVMEL